MDDLARTDFPRCPGPNWDEYAEADSRPVPDFLTAKSDAFLLTGRLSATEPGWLGDHAVFGTVLVPGTGLLELGFAAARAVGATTVSQLTLVAPLMLPPEGAVRVQVATHDALQAQQPVALRLLLCRRQDIGVLVEHRLDLARPRIRVCLEQ